MSKEHYFNRLEFLIHNDEDISALFRKICRYYNANGKIQNKLSSSNPSGNFKRHIHLAFNMECIKSTYIDLKLFFEDFKEYQKQEWIDRIFTITGIEKKLKSEEKAEKQDYQRILTGKLEVNFPGLINIIKYLEDNEFLVRYTEDVLLNALELFNYIINNKEIIDFSELGAKVLGDSKAVREKTELFNLVEKMLIFNSDFSEVLKENSNDSKDIFELYNIISNLTAIKVTMFGPFCYEKKGFRFDFIERLWNIGESITLTMDNLKNISLFELKEGFDLLTCENESSFNLLKRNSENLAVIFTSGYPNSAVKKILELLKGKNEFVYHWGDSDLAGYCIASIIHKIIPVKLWHCDINSLKTKKEKLIRINDHEKRYKIEQFIIKNPDFPFRNELLFTLKNGWLEQENW